jgi:N-hydroxyarylamine O-acetyltransferase
MLDLDAYLQRIGYRGARAPTLPVLTAICAAQPAAIAFENIDPLLGLAPDLAPTALQDKLVSRRRGGYCYELNALLRLALRALGFEVTALAARVVWMSAPAAPLRPRSHMLLKVALPQAPHATYLADAGFGGHLLGAPLRLQSGLAQPTPDGRARVSRDGDLYAVEVETTAGWSALYRCTLDALEPVDYLPLNWYTATHPASIFRHNLLLERLSAQRRVALFNDRLIVRDALASPVERRIGSAAEFARVLDELFELEPPVPAAELFDRVPRGFDAMVVPSAA